MKGKEVILKNVLMSIFISLLVLAIFFMVKGYLAGYFRSVESLRAYISTFGMFGPLMLILIQAFQVVLPVLPGFLGCFVGAGLFGIFGGFWCNYIGISAGSIIAFLLARWLGREMVTLLVPMEKYKRFVQWLNKQKSYTLILFLAILLPLAPDDFLCYFSGLMGMTVKKFVWIIVLAKPWCILFYCVMFAYFM